MTTVNVSIALVRITRAALPYGRVKFELTGADVAGAIVVPQAEFVTCDLAGLGSVALMPNSDGTQGTRYAVTVFDSAGVQQWAGYATVPASDCSLHEILNTPAPQTVGDAQAAAIAAQASAAVAQTALASALAIGADLPNLDNVAADLANIDLVAAARANVNTVAGSIASVNSAASNMAAIVDAPNQATAAAVARTAAEAARDSVNTTGKVFADTTAGIAGTTNGQTFAVLSTDLSYWIVYKNNAGAALEVARSYTTAYTDKMALLAGGNLAALTDTVYGFTSPDNNSASAGLAWTNHTGLPADMLLRKIAVRVSGAGTGKIIVVNRYNVVISDTSVVTAAGVNTFTIAPALLVPAGARVFFLATTGLIRYAALGGTAYYFSASDYTGVLGDAIAPGTSAGADLALEFTFSSLTETHDVAIHVLEDGELRRASHANALASGAVIPYNTTEAATDTWTIGSPNIAFWEFALDAGVDLIVGAIVNAVAADLIAATGTDRFRVRVYERATANGDIQAIDGTDTLLCTVSKTPADLGLTLDAAASASVTFPLTPFKVKNAMTYHVIVEGFTSANALANFGLGSVQTAFAESRQRRCGWYRAVGIGFVAVPSAFLRSSIGLLCSTSAAMPKRVLDRVIDASVSVAGMNVTVLAVLERNGVARVVHTTKTIAAATSTNIRYDTIYYDPENKNFGVAAGTERATDPSEFIPTLADSKYLPLCNVRATSAAVTSVGTWDVFNGEWRALEAELEEERRRGRMCLQKVLGKIRRGAAVKLCVVGDSISGVGGGGVGSQATPNGPYRDRPIYFTDSIGSDLVNTYPLYTALQLGRADDGLGAVHSKLGYMWDLYDAIAAAGSAVTFDNFGVASTTTANVWSAGAATSWLIATRALAADVYVINFGMNERGDTTTEASMVGIIGYLKANGAEVVVAGLVRPNNANAAAVANWEYTNRALRRAAIYAGAAFLPTQPLYATSYLGVLGCTAEDTCSANRINHPGIREHRAIGRELVKLFMGAA